MAPFFPGSIRLAAVRRPSCWRGPGRYPCGPALQTTFLVAGPQHSSLAWFCLRPGARATFLPPLTDAISTPIYRSC